jgi:hypothetical protein
VGQDYESGDQQLEDALEQLKTIPQSTIASRIGISERRFRDIEQGRSSPRPRTRSAILGLADVLRGREPSNGESNSWRSENSASGLPPTQARTADVLSEGQMNPILAIGVGTFLVVAFIAAICLGPRLDDK